MCSTFHFSLRFTFIQTILILLINLYRSQHNLFTIALFHLLHFSSNEITVLFSWFSRIHHIASTINHTWITIYYYFSTTKIFFSWVFNGIQSMLFHLVDDLLLFHYCYWMDVNGKPRSCRGLSQQLLHTLFNPIWQWMLNQLLFFITAFRDIWD